MLNTSCNLLSTERKKQWLSWVSNGCKCIHCFSLWLHDLLRALTVVAVQYHESIASLGKDQNSKCEVWFLLNAYCFPTIVKLNPHKSGTVCSTNGKTRFPDTAFSPSKYNSAESTILKNSLTILLSQVPSQISWLNHHRILVKWAHKPTLQVRKHYLITFSQGHILLSRHPIK